MDKRLLDAIQAGQTAATLGDMPEDNIVKSLAKGAYDAFTLPEDVRRGVVDPTSDEGIARSLNLASSIGLGSAPRALTSSGRIPAPATSSEGRGAIPTVEASTNRATKINSYEDLLKELNKDYGFTDLKDMEALLNEKLNPGYTEPKVEVPSYYKSWPKDMAEHTKQMMDMIGDWEAEKISGAQYDKRWQELQDNLNKNILNKPVGASPPKGWEEAGGPVDVGPSQQYPESSWGNKRKASRLIYEDDYVGPPDPRRELPGTPLERAIAQGYKGPFYSGVKTTTTEVPVYGFNDPRTAEKFSEPGIFLTDKPHIAEDYSYKGMTIPLMARMENPRVIDMGGKHYENAWMDRILNEAIDAGHDSVIIKNMQDLGGMQDQYVILEPNRLRSPWANFDPMLKESRNLLSGTAAGAIGIKELSDWIEQDRKNRL